MHIVKLGFAAKTDVGLVRKNNEDNFAVVPDLASGSACVAQEESVLGNKGALLVVADGMGGMNAGEVASAVAVKSLCRCFAPKHLVTEVTASDDAITHFMEEALEKADRDIKAESRRHAESKVMGTTAVVAWILGQRLYISWCGDSRGYVYSKMSGLRQLTKDHSYVQQLVDEGLITHEEAAYHPQRNIVTRALSDTSREPQPESLSAPCALQEGDIVMLCTDGLNGTMTDDDMEHIVKCHENDMEACADALIEAALERGGGDNVTVVLGRVGVEDT